jgi:hypothetical protein
MATHLRKSKPLPDAMIRSEHNSDAASLAMTKSGERLRPFFAKVVDRDARRASGALLVLITVFTLLVLPPIVIDVEMHRPLYSAGPGSLSSDMLLAHLPQINYFIAHPLKVVEYPGIVTSLPGHHILLAWVARLLGYDSIDSKTLPIRLVHAFICGLGAVGLFIFLHRMQYFQCRAPSVLMSMVLWISVIASFYFLQSSIYISTDVPAGGLYITFLYLMIFYPQAIAVQTISATALMFWRQSYAPVLLAPFLTERDQILGKLLSQRIVLILVPTTVLLFYFIHFGGLVPANSGGPTDILRGIGGLFPQSILHVLALLGLLLPVYTLIFGKEIVICYRLRSTVSAMIALSSFVVLLWIFTPSNYDYEAGRWGSIVWTLSKYSPHWANHSVLILLLDVLGVTFIVFLAWLAANYKGVRPIVVGMFLYLVSQIIVPLAFQRYVEPIILISLALVAAGTVTAPSWRLVIFATIFSFYGLASILRIYNIFPVGWITP